MMIPNTHDTRVTSTVPGRDTGDTIVTYEDGYGNTYRKHFTCGTNVSISVSKWSSSDNVQPNRIEVTRTVVPEFKDEKTKYWRPPDPPHDPRKLPSVREDRRAKRVVLRPEFHARSNPRSR